MSEHTSQHPTALDLTRAFGDVELPTAGLWNVPPGWATIELSVPRLLGATMRSRVRLKQGMIAIADDPSHSTAHLSLDALSIRTGDEVIDEFLQQELLDVDRYSTIPVRIASVRHRSGRSWTADGWITVRGITTPIDFDITYEGVFHKGAAFFQAQANLPLRHILPTTGGLRGRFFASRTLRIAIEVYAEPLRTAATSRREPAFA